MQYIKQTDDYSCASIAILNALKWIGLKVSKKKDFDRISILASVYPEYGACNQQDFETTLLYESRNKLKIKKIFKPTLKKIIQHLEKDLNKHSAIIKFVERDEKFGHFAFIETYKRDQFKIVNFTQGEKISIVDTIKIEDILLNTCKNKKDDIRSYPFVWLLEKS